MDRSTSSLASVVLLLLALMMPWFTMSISESYEYRENREEDGKQITHETTTKQSYYLDRLLLKGSSEEGESGLLGIDAETESKSGTYVYYEQSLEGNSGSAGATSGFMYGLYKIFLLILLLRIALFFAENILDKDILENANLFLSIAMLLLIIVFIFGFKGSFIMDNNDRVILEKNAADESDVNMTLIIGLGSVTDENTTLDYRVAVESYFYEEIRIDAPPAAWIDSGDYFYFSSGQNISQFYAWFDKNGDGTTDKPSPQSGGMIEVHIDISELADNDSREDMAREIHATLLSEVPDVFTVTLNGSAFNQSLNMVALIHGETTDPSNYNVGNFEIYTIDQGRVETYFNDIYSDTETKAMWYPSWGFILFFASALLTYASREK